jgi:hypothetical protein
MVSTILALFLLAQAALVNTSSAQSCQYSPYWGLNGELWNPNGPLKDYSHAGYHEGNDPTPYRQRAATVSFGPGRHTLTQPITLTKGVLRGAGVDQTTLVFPQGIQGMGHFNKCVYSWKQPQNGCDWSTGVIDLRGTEVGLEDVTIEFPPHTYRHHEGKGYNGVTLQNCAHCWVSHIRIVNADEGIGIIGGHHNTVEHFEIQGGYHVHVHQTRTHDNLVWHGQASGGTVHGFVGHYEADRSVYANLVGHPVVIEPDHQSLGVTGMLYSNLQGTGGKKIAMSDTFLWNFMNQKLCPVDIYQAQLAKRLGTPLPLPPLPSVVFVNAGGSNYSDGEGNRWSADQSYAPGRWGYTSGKTYRTSATIANTTDDVLYQTERYGNFSYKFDVANGEYDVTLYFTEIYHTAAGRRLFDVRIEGDLVLDNFDIYAIAGRNTAMSVTFPDIAVEDGQLTIDFVTVKDQAKVSAIEIQLTKP